MQTLHEATHRMPGVPGHQERPEGHQGATRHGRAMQGGARATRGVRPHHSPAAVNARPPRVLVGWQNRIAGLFARKGD
ncbi:hypothetical protein [Agromyces sp. CF514]|uniref:hypothetical protein n=1 Tax=Agromyces sp. CF514 TaxID=1881031 RepID=UPI001160E256|nr:hypothetical protein [Agromyces sp. CF514]